MIEESDSNLCACCNRESRNYKSYSRYNQLPELCTDCWELEGVIDVIVERKKAAEIDSPEWLAADRELDELRNTREFAGPLIEDLDWNS